jgi:enediyne biosynthesis protein E4
VNFLRSTAFLVLCAVVWASAAAPNLAAQGMASHQARPGVRVETDRPPIKVHFEDVAVQAGLTAVNVSGNPDKKTYIVETTGNGVTIFDYDNDGLMDIFLPNGATLQDPAAGRSVLYRNTGNLHFEDVTAKAGLEKAGWAQGACVGDYDNDGNRDLLVTYWGHSTLFHNNGGTFTDVTEQAGLMAAAVRWDTGCTFFDYDLDGRLDLAITGYVDFDLDKVPAPGTGGYCQWKGMPVMCGPRGLPTGRNHLFHNEGGGRFQDVSVKSTIAAPTNCYGFTALASDFDNDGYPDLYVACDSTPSLLYLNRKNGVFEESGILTGVALNEDGQEQAGMGVAVADYDEDGLFDLIKTNFADDTPNLYHNNGDGTFTDNVYLSGLGIHTQFLGWGVHFLDVDCDGLEDVLMVNGHVYPEVDQANLSTYRQQRLFYWNVGKGRFVDLSEKAGPGITDRWSSRGSAQADLDNDGSLEVVINNIGARPSLLKNSGPKKNWLLASLVGTQCNRDAIGARAFVFTGEQRHSGEVHGGSGFLSQNDPRLHFGLGDSTRYDRIEVQWPGGGREVFPGGDANRIVVLKQGQGKPAPASDSK